MMYDVTIGIPVYNVGKYIRLTMESALAQTLPNIEFLVLDDCGTDESIDIVREYQKTHPRGKDIHIIHQPQNGGLGRARNRIIEGAEGTYLYHLDADDAIAPNTIELLYENAKKYDADIVYGSYERILEFSETTKKEKHCYPYKVFLKENEFADFVYNDYDFLQATTWNFLIKRDIYIKNNIRHKSVNYWEDFSTTIDLPTYVTRAILLPDITYFYYCHYGSLSNYRERDYIEKTEFLKTIRAMDLVKQNSDRIKQKPYFHKRMYKVMMTHFYMACSILKYKKITFPAFTNKEICDVLTSPLSLLDIIRLKGWRFKNFVFYLFGVMPSTLSVLILRILAKSKKLI